MTFDIDRSLERAMAGGPGAGTAFDEVAARGEAAIPPILAILAKGEGLAMGAMMLASLEVADRAMTLEPLAHDSRREIRSAAVIALGRCRDPKAVDVLARVIAGGDHLGAAIASLGDLGSSAGVGVVRATLEKRVGNVASAAHLAVVTRQAIEDGDPSDLLLIGEAVRSLAKLGDQSLCEVALALSQFHAAPSSGFYEEASIKLTAIAALDVSVGRGVATALHRCCVDPDGEVSEAALRASLHLGRVSELELWASLGTSMARWCIQEMTGESPPATEMKRWLTEIERRFVRGVCYRRGAPASPAILVADATGSKITRSELRQMTGLPFVLPELDGGSPAELAAIQTWWKQHAAEFPPGKLHRWGRTFEPGAVDA